MHMVFHPPGPQLVFRVVTRLQKCKHKCARSLKTYAQDWNLSLPQQATSQSKGYHGVKEWKKFNLHHHSGSCKALLQGTLSVEGERIIAIFATNLSWEDKTEGLNEKLAFELKYKEVWERATKLSWEKSFLSWRTSRAMSLRQGHAWIIKEKKRGDCSSGRLNTPEDICWSSEVWAESGWMTPKFKALTSWHKNPFGPLAVRWEEMPLSQNGKSSVEQHISNCFKQLSNFFQWNLLWSCAIYKK